MKVSTYQKDFDYLLESILDCCPHCNCKMDEDLAVWNKTVITCPNCKSEIHFLEWL